MDSATYGEGGEAGQEPPARVCMACRGSGKVISHLGGEPKDVTCPWCGGSGTRGAIADAQAKWKDPEEGSEST